MKKLTKIVFICLLLFHTINNILWLSIDGKQHIGCFVILHLERAQEIHENINSQGYLHRIVTMLTYLSPEQFRQKITSNLPSGYAIITLFLSQILFIPIDFIELTNLIYLGILLLSTYFLAKQLFDRKTALISIFLLSFYPYIYGMSRKFIAETALIAITASAYYFLVKTNYFKNIRSSIALGAVSFIAILIQPLYTIFISGGFLYSVFKIIQKEHAFLARRLLNIFICLLIAISALFFAYDDLHDLKINLNNTFKDMYITATTFSKNFIGNADSGVNDLFLYASPNDHCPCTQVSDRGINLRCILFYFIQMIDIISPLLGILFCISIFITKNNSEKYPGAKTLLLFWIGTSYLFLMLMPQKWARFFAAAAPAMAILTSAGIMQIKKIKIKKIVLVVLAFIAIVQFFFYSYILYPHTPPLCIIKEYINAHKPLKTNYSEIVLEIAKNIQFTAKNKSRIKIGFFSLVTFSDRFSERWYNDATYYFRFLLNLYKQPNTSITLKWVLSEEIIKDENYDYIILLQDNFILPEEIADNYKLMDKASLYPSKISVSHYKLNN